MSHAVDSPPPQTLPPRGGGKAEAFWSLLGTVMFGAILVAICVFIVPGIVTDWQVRGTAEPATTARIADGSCSTRLMVTTCDATLSLPGKSGPITRDINLLFTSAGTGNLSVAVMADPARPEWMTTDIGLDRLWNRTITALVIGGVLLVLTVAPLVAVVRRLRRA